MLTFMYLLSEMKPLRIERDSLFYILLLFLTLNALPEKAIFCYQIK